MDQFLTVLIIIGFVNISFDLVSAQSLYRNEWNLITLIEQKYKMGLTAIDSDFIMNLTAKDHSFQFPAQTIFSKLTILEDAFFYIKFYPTTSSFTILTIKDPHDAIRFRIRGFEKRDQLKQLRLSVLYDPIAEKDIGGYRTETEITVPFQKSMWTLGILLENRKITFYTSCDDVLKPLGYHQSQNSASTNVKFFDQGSTLFLLNNGELNKNIEKFEGKISDFLLTRKAYVNEVMCQKNEIIEGSGRQSRKWEPHFIGNYLITEKSTTITMAPTTTLQTTRSTASTMMSTTSPFITSVPSTSTMMSTTSPFFTSVPSTSTTKLHVTTSKPRIRSENQPIETVISKRNTILPKISISKIPSNQIMTSTNHNIRTVKPKSRSTESTIQTKIPLIKQETILSNVSSMEQPTNTPSVRNLKFSKSLELNITDTKMQSDPINIFKLITKPSNKLKTIAVSIFDAKSQTISKNPNSTISSTLKFTPTEQDNKIRLKKINTPSMSNNITKTTETITTVLNVTEPIKSTIKTTTIKTINDTIKTKTTSTKETQSTISVQTTNSPNKSTTSLKTTTLVNRKTPTTNTIKTHPSISTTIMALADTNKTTIVARSNLNVTISTKIGSKLTSVNKNPETTFIPVSTTISRTRSTASSSNNILVGSTAQLLKTSVLLLNSTAPEKIRSKTVIIKKKGKQFSSTIPTIYKTILIQKITQLNTSGLTNSSKKTSNTTTTKYIPITGNTNTTTETQPNVFVKAVLPPKTTTTAMRTDTTKLFYVVNSTSASSDSNTRSTADSKSSVTTNVQPNATIVLRNKTISTQKITQLSTSELTNSSKETSNTIKTKYIPITAKTNTTTKTHSNVFIKTVVSSETTTTPVRTNVTKLFYVVNSTSASSDSKTRSRADSKASVTTNVQPNATIVLLNTTKFINISFNPVRVTYSTITPTISNKIETSISSRIPIIGNSENSTISVTTPLNKIKPTNARTKSTFGKKTISSTLTLETTVTLKTKPTSPLIPIISLATILLNGTKLTTVKTKKKVTPSTKQMTSEKTQNLITEQKSTASIEKQSINSSVSITLAKIISITPNTTTKSTKSFTKPHIKVNMTSNITKTTNKYTKTSMQIDTTTLLSGNITLLKRTMTSPRSTLSTIKHLKHITSSKGYLKNLTTSVRKITKITIVPTLVNTNTTIHMSKTKTMSLKRMTSTKEPFSNYTSKGCYSEILNFTEVSVKGHKGSWGEMGEKGNKGSVGSYGKNGICNSKVCSSATILKGLKGETGQCVAANCQKENVNKGDSGSKGNKGDKGNAVKISDVITFLLPEVKFTIDEIIKKNIMNLKGEPGSCSCPPKANGQQFKVQTTILNDAKELKSLSSNMPVGQMAFLISENILLIKIDRVINHWRVVKMDTSKRDWFFTSKISKIPKSVTLNIGSKLMLVALPKPTAGNLRSDSYDPGAYSGSSFLCQKEAYNYGLGRSFYPLLNTDMFDLSYMLPEKYRYGVPIVNRRNERIADSFVDLIQTSTNIGANILDFKGDSIMSDENQPCVWVGEKPNLQEPKRSSEHGLCLNWMSKRPNNIATVAILKMNKPLLDSNGNHTKSCNSLCYVLCLQIYPLMSDARKH